MGSGKKKKHKRSSPPPLKIAKSKVKLTPALIPPHVQSSGGGRGGRGGGVLCQLNSAAKHGKLLLLPPRTAREVSPSARNIGSPEEAPSSRRRAAFSSSPVPSPGHVGGSSQFVWRRSSAKFRRASARGPRCHARCSKGPTVYRAGLTDGEAFSHSPTSSSNLLAVGRATRGPFFFSFLFRPTSRLLTGSCTSAIERPLLLLRS